MKIVSIAVASALTIGTIAFAESPKEADYPQVEQLITEKLDTVSELSDAQKEKIRGLMREQLAAIHKLTRQYLAEQRGLMETLHDAAVEENAIRKQANKMANVLIEYAKRRAELAKQIRDVLTSEQLDKAREQQQGALAKIAGFVDEVAKRLAAE